MSSANTEFPRHVSGLPAASATPVVELSDGDRFSVRIAAVTKRLGDEVTP